MGRWKTNISKIEKHLLALGTIHLIAASATSQGFHTQFNLPGKKATTKCERKCIH